MWSLFQTSSLLALCVVQCVRVLSPRGFEGFELSLRSFHEVVRQFDEKLFFPGVLGLLLVDFDQIGAKISAVRGFPTIRKA